mmetsp:Transcript_8355/g.26489  ORF Transcript_8355/g.26489 Transcript_8355/m.26489 type:complete len:202 (+) Transcript_8355:290-895(+)
MASGGRRRTSRQRDCESSSHGGCPRVTLRGGAQSRGSWTLAARRAATAATRRCSARRSRAVRRTSCSGLLREGCGGSRRRSRRCLTAISPSTSTRRRRSRCERRLFTPRAVNRSTSTGRRRSSGACLDTTHLQWCSAPPPRSCISLRCWLARGHPQCGGAPAEASAPPRSPRPRRRRRRRPPPPGGAAAAECWGGAGLASG